MHDKNTGCHHDTNDNHADWANKEGKNTPCWRCNVCGSFNGWMDEEDKKAFLAKYFNSTGYKQAMMKRTTPLNVRSPQQKLF